MKGTELEARIEQGRINAEKKRELKRRVVECARKDPEITSRQLSERFSVSRASVNRWLDEAGVTAASYDMVGCYVASPPSVERMKRRAAR